MVTLELPNDEAQKLIWAWENKGILSGEYELVQQDGYIHLRWLYNVFHYARNTYDLIHSILRNFLGITLAPYVCESESLGNYLKMYTPNYETRCFKTQYMFESYEFRWPQQLERYRVALLLKATE